MGGERAVEEREGCCYGREKSRMGEREGRDEEKDYMDTPRLPLTPLSRGGNELGPLITALAPRPATAGRTGCWLCVSYLLVAYSYFMLPVARCHRRRCCCRAIAVAAPRLVTPSVFVNLAPPPTKTPVASRAQPRSGALGLAPSQPARKKAQQRPITVNRK